MLWVALHFPSLPAGELQAIAAWTCQFTPKVALEPPDAVLAELSGSLRYFGGRDACIEALKDRLSELGVDASVGTGSTARAALWRARGSSDELEALPLEVTRRDLDFCRSIGIATLGELLRLPREGLAARCGQALLDDLDRALGMLPEAHAFFAPPERFYASLELPAEITESEAVLFPVRRLLVQLAGLLAARHAGTRSFVLTLVHARGPCTVLDVRLATAARDAERFTELLRERLLQVQLPRPVEAIRVQAQDFTPLEARSGGLFGDAAADGEDWARLLERLQARLGRDAVYGLTVSPDHRPEYAWRRVAPGEWDPREFKPPGPRPAWLIEPARRLPEAGLALLVGPERIECGWWDGDDAQRDYFVARLKDDAVGWVYREDGHWYLHGLFA